MRYSSVTIINVSTERLKRRPMLQQMGHSALRQTLQVLETSDTEHIQSSN